MEPIAEGAQRSQGAQRGSNATVFPDGLSDARRRSVHGSRRRPGPGFSAISSHGTIVSMRRTYATQEEILARKLLNVLGSLAGLLIFAGVVFHFASSPPTPSEAGSPARGSAPAAHGGAPSDQETVSTFNDRLARIRLGAAPLAERTAAAEALHAQAQSPAEQRLVEALLRELAQEQDGEAVNRFNALRQQNVALTAANRFDEIETTLAAFQADNPRLEELVNGERRLLVKRRAAAFAEKEQAAHAAINRGDVEAVKKLAEEARPLAGPDEREEPARWIAEVEARRSAAEGGAPPAKVEPGAEVASVPPDAPKETAKEPSPAQPAAEGGKEPATESAPAATAQPFSGVVKAGLSGTFVIPEEQSAVTIDASKATILADTRIAPKELAERLTRGSALWILGVTVQKKGPAPEFGGELVQRTIEKARLAVAGKDFLPDLGWEDPACKGRRWLFGTVELAYPVLRVAVEGVTYTVAAGEPAPPVVLRAKVTALPALPEGAPLLVKGARSGTAIAADELIVPAPELAENQGYAGLFAR